MTAKREKLEICGVSAVRAENGYSSFVRDGEVVAAVQQLLTMCIVLRPEEEDLELRETWQVVPVLLKALGVPSCNRNPAMKEMAMFLWN